MGEKTRTASDGSVPQAIDHDPPPKEKLVPFGILVITTGLLTLVFGNKECSDFWGDCMKCWWTHARASHKGIRRLVIYLDNGPKNSGVTRKFLRRMVEFADWSGLEIRLVYYPPYHSKYNPVERCWSALQQKWNGALLTCWKVVKGLALRMRWNQEHPEIRRITKRYKNEKLVTKQEMSYINSRIIRSEHLPKYDLIIKPKTTRGR